MFVYSFCVFVAIIQAPNRLATSHCPKILRCTWMLCPPTNFLRHPAQTSPVDGIKQGAQALRPKEIRAAYNIGNFPAAPEETSLCWFLVAGRSSDMRKCSSGRPYADCVNFSAKIGCSRFSVLFASGDSGCS